MPADGFSFFRDPGSEFRGKPFWAWNGRLEPEELRRQIRVMKRMGLGGFFMHSRVGLATPYLSGEWFECVDACIDEAKKLGMEAWLYDEDRWPSGAAGGLVTRNPAYRERMIVVEKYDHPARLVNRKNVVAAFTARIEEPSAFSVARVPLGKTGTLTRPGESLLVFRRRIAGNTSWHNGYTYLDTLNRKAVREFIRVTHETYRRKVGGSFGRLVPGIFTDEPNFTGFNDAPRWSPPHDYFLLPWTDSLPGVFRKRYGYDLIPLLPQIVLDVDGAEVSRARWHFHDCVTAMFVDAFARQIGEWCERAGIAHTGHVLEESPLSGQVHVAGSCMRFYEHMQAPGMDILTERWREYDTAKQVSSAARQFGRKWRLSETYGCSGWDFSFEGQKAVGDWQAALGINLRCQHLSWYTMEGVAKRDYPPCMLHQSPWWDSYPKVEDYFARIHAVMTRGSEVRDLLVVHPVESMWVKCRRGWMSSAGTKACDRSLVDLRDTLLAANVDFDYGDEEILSRHGRVKRRTGGSVLVVGRAEYRAVVVPPLVTIRRSTLALLAKFRDAGGRVVFAGETPPAHVDATPSADAAIFAAGCDRADAKGDSLVAAVEDICRRVSIFDERGEEIAPALHLLREDAGSFYLFVCNTGHDFRGADGDPRVCDRRLEFPSVTVRAPAGARGTPVELDPETGRVWRAAARKAAGRWEVSTSLPRVGSRLFLFPKRKKAAAVPRRPNLKEVRRYRLGAAWRIGLSEMNNVVLDRPRFRIGGGSWRGPGDILGVDDAVRDRLKVPRRGGQMVQPWARIPAADPKRVRVDLKYEFTVAAAPPRDGVFLAVERPELFRIAVNGRRVEADAASGWWVDRSLKLVCFGAAALKRGRNVVTMECDYAETHPGLEVVYLVGDFGARVKRGGVTVTSLPRSLKIGDWGPQGLPFYSGSVTYRKTLHVRPRKRERYFIRVPDYRGVAVKVLVDGRFAGAAAWQPNEVEITSLLKPGAVEVAVEVVGHRRNSHGPFYLNEKWPPLTGPWSFHDGGHFPKGYQLVPCGLMSPPQLVVKKRA